MSTSQLPNEAATSQEEANELALLESFDAGEWASSPNEARYIASYRASAKRSVARTLTPVEAQTWNGT